MDTFWVLIFKFLRLLSREFNDLLEGGRAGEVPLLGNGKLEQGKERQGTSMF